jgi:hypothetical protein
MASRCYDLVRSWIAMLGFCLVTLALVGCGSSSAVDTQNPTSGPASATNTSSPASPVSRSPSSSITTTPISTSSTRPSSTIATPTVNHSGQGAVDAYIAFYNLSTSADRDPAHVDIAELDQYLTGKAKSLYDGVYASMKSAGLAYRGTPDAPRLTVGSVLSPRFVFLTSCPAASATNPFVQYKVSTGKPIVTKKPRVPPPWKRTISMRKVGSSWKVSDILVDTSKTCSG